MGLSPWSGDQAAEESRKALTDVPGSSGGPTAAGLSHAATLAWTALKGCLSVEQRLGMAIKAGKMPERSLYDDLREARTRILDALNVLTANGATLPDDLPNPDSEVLSLPRLDTLEARELLVLLQQAQAVAEKVDSQRGHVLPDHIPIGSLESRGTDYAESISNLAIRLHMEVNPPKGRD